MVKRKYTVTGAIRDLRKNGISFTAHTYKHHEKDVAVGAAKELGVEEHFVVKTLVMEDDQDQPLIILMHGDRQVSTKALARTIGAKSVNACIPEVAHKHTGYRVGGISPLGLRKALPVYIEASILGLPRIFINAGKKGFLVEICPTDLMKLLRATPVDVAR